MPPNANWITAETAAGLYRADKVSSSLVELTDDLYAQHVEAAAASIIAKGAVDHRLL